MAFMQSKVFPCGSMVKNSPASAGDAGDMGSIPGSRRSPGGGNDNPLQYFLPRKSHRQRSLAGYRPWDCKDSDITEQLSTHANRLDDLNHYLLQITLVHK